MQYTGLLTAPCVQTLTLMDFNRRLKITNVFAKNPAIGRVLISQPQFKVNEGQLVGAHLKLVVCPENTRHSAAE